MSFREFFFQFSILTPPFLYYNRRTPPVARFFDRLCRRCVPVVRSGGFYCLISDDLLLLQGGQVCFGQAQQLTVNGGVVLT